MGKNLTKDFSSNLAKLLPDPSNCIWYTLHVTTLRNEFIVSVNGICNKLL